MPPLLLGLGRVLSWVSQIVSVQNARSVGAEPLLVTVYRTSISAPYTACPGTTTPPVTRSASGWGSTKIGTAARLLFSLGYSSMLPLASATTRTKPEPLKRAGITMLGVSLG